MTAAPLIETAGLAKRFGALSAVRDLTFSVAPGEIFGLVGPDGAGKTTTVRMLAGVMRADAGTIRIDGIDVIGDPEQAKQHVSYMPQRFGLYEDLTVDENIRFYSDLFGIPRKLRETRAARLLEASGMTGFRGRLAGRLSGGMKQKLGLACALIHSPRVVLLDEPTTGVDPVSRREFWHILYSLRAEGVSILISTAYLDEAERCNRLALMHQGRMLYCDTPAGLKARMPGALLAVRTAAPQAVRDHLARCPGVSGVLAVGDGVHVHVDDAARRIPELQAALAGSGLEAGGIVPTAPTIEDLFVTLLDPAERPA